MRSIAKTENTSNYDKHDTNKEFSRAILNCLFEDKDKAYLRIPMANMMFLKCIAKMMFCTFIAKMNASVRVFKKGKSMLPDFAVACPVARAPGRIAAADCPSRQHAGSDGLRRRRANTPGRKVSRGGKVVITTGKKDSIWGNNGLYG